MKKLLVILFSVFVLAGCGGGETKEPTTNNNNNVKEYTFTYNNTTIKMNDDLSNILDTLGEEISYFEAPSCAFDGLDKTYTYPGFQLTTYPKGKVDHVSAVVFKDDTVTTAEGIYVGSSKADVVKAYGEDYEDKSGTYVYTSGKSQLEFIFDGDTAISITYRAITE